MRSAGSRLVALAALCAVVAFILWQSGDRPKPPVFVSDAMVAATPAPEPDAPPPAVPTPEPVVTQAPPPPPPPAPVAVRPMVPPTPIASRIAARMAAPGSLPPSAPPGPAPMEEVVQSDINNLLTAFRDYSFALDGNPWGTNAEITKALNGGNAKGIRFPFPEGNSLNNKGELCDRWGSPYFFHQVSGKKMEVRSAGADREMWTSDDIQR